MALQSIGRLRPAMCRLLEALETPGLLPPAHTIVDHAAKADAKKLENSKAFCFGKEVRATLHRLVTRCRTVGQSNNFLRNLRRTDAAYFCQVDKAQWQDREFACLALRGFATRVNTKRAPTKHAAHLMPKPSTWRISANVVPESKSRTAANSLRPCHGGAWL